MQQRLATVVGIFGVLLGIRVLAWQSQAPAGHVPDHMEHRFDNPEQSAKQFDDPARDVWQMPDRVIATLGLKAGQSVADIGAGTGYFSMRVAKSSARCSRGPCPNPVSPTWRSEMVAKRPR